MACHAMGASPCRNLISMIGSSRVICRHLVIRAECRCFFLTSSQPMSPTVTGERLNARSANVRRPFRSNTNRVGNLMRVVFAPATSYSDSIARPGCSECGTATFLVGIKSERPGYALITFECPKCEHFETALWKAAQAIRSGRGPWEGNVRLTAAQCRQYAEECIAMAERARRENVASLHRMAGTWLDLAEQLRAPMTGSDQNAPSTDKVQ